MKILIFKNNDRHTIRLIDGFKSINIDPFVTNSLNEAINNDYDIALIDPSINFDLKNKIKTKYLGFFDTEDSPYHFEKNEAYESLKDSAHFYAKMNYVENDRNDNIKNIAFPIAPYSQLISISKQKCHEFTYENSIPFFVGSGTYIGNYNGTAKQEEYLGSKSLYIDNNIILYNQRIQWLNSLKKNNIYHFGKIVFSSNNLSLLFQEKHFGNVNVFSSNPISRSEYINILSNHYKIALCPTGHERMSWRLFDIMASGAILIWTDNKKQKCMYNPIEAITIKDHEDIGSILLNLQSQYKEIYKSHQTNKQVFCNLTPEKILQDFINSIK